jgi:septum formation topological specificity factor MinE
VQPENKATRAASAVNCNLFITFPTILQSLSANSAKNILNLLLARQRRNNLKQLRCRRIRRGSIDVSEQIAQRGRDAVAVGKGGAESCFGLQEALLPEDFAESGGAVNNPIYSVAQQRAEAAQRLDGHFL